MEMSSAYVVNDPIEHFIYELTQLFQSPVAYPQNTSDATHRDPPSRVRDQALQNNDSPRSKTVRTPQDHEHRKSQAHQLPTPDSSTVHQPATAAPSVEECVQRLGQAIASSIVQQMGSAITTGSGMLSSMPSVERRQTTSLWDGPPLPSRTAQSPSHRTRRSETPRVELTDLQNEFTYSSSASGDERPRSPATHAKRRRKPSSTKAQDLTQVTGLWENDRTENGRFWSVEDELIVRDFIQHPDRKDKPLKELAMKLPHKSEGAVKVKEWKMRQTLRPDLINSAKQSRPDQKWSQAQDAIILQFARNYSRNKTDLKDLFAHLPNIPPALIKHRLDTLVNNDGQPAVVDEPQGPIDETFVSPDLGDNRSGMIMNSDDQPAMFDEAEGSIELTKHPSTRRYSTRNVGSNITYVASAPPIDGGKFNDWTESEDECVRAFVEDPDRASKGARELQSQLPHRTLWAIKSRERALRKKLRPDLGHLQVKPTKADIDLIYLPSKQTQGIPEEGAAHKKWTAGEIKALVKLKLDQKLSYEEIRLRMPWRGLSSIQNSWKFWKRGAYDDFLRDNSIFSTSQAPATFSTPEKSRLPLQRESEIPDRIETSTHGARQVEHDDTSLVDPSCEQSIKSTIDVEMTEEGDAAISPELTSKQNSRHTPKKPNRGDVALAPTAGEDEHETATSSPNTSRSKLRVKPRKTQKKLANESDVPPISLSQANKADSTQPSQNVSKDKCVNKTSRRTKSLPTPTGRVSQNDLRTSQSAKQSQHSSNRPPTVDLVEDSEDELAM